MSDELIRFYKEKSKKPDLFSYDDDGNLIELNKEGSVIKTIPLPTYRHPTYEEFDIMEKSRMEEIAKYNKEFNDLKKELHELYINPETSDSNIIKMNRNVTNADIKLQSIRFPLQYISIIKKVPIDKIDFTQPNEKRKYRYPFNILQVNPFTLQEQYVRIGELPVKPLLSIPEIQNQGVVILFSDPQTNEYGYLSLKWVVQIEFNGIMYHSVHQALYAELAKSFNDQENLHIIMEADTPNAFHYSLDDIPDKEVNEPKWNELINKLIFDINLIKFNQYPELSLKLLETKNATLGAYIPDDNLIGIGISLDNIQSKNPVNWTGQNILGKALMDIRETLKLNPIKPVRKRPIAKKSIKTEVEPVQKTVRRPAPPRAAVEQVVQVPEQVEQVPEQVVQVPEQVVQVEQVPITPLKKAPPPPIRPVQTALPVTQTRKAPPPPARPVQTELPVTQPRKAPPPPARPVQPVQESPVQRLIRRRPMSAKVSEEVPSETVPSIIKRIPRINNPAS